MGTVMLVFRLLGYFIRCQRIFIFAGRTTPKSGLSYLLIVTAAYG
jgi:hypothetical protein